MIEERLGAADGESRDDHGTAPTDCPIDDVLQRCFGVCLRMNSVAVGRLHHEVIRVRDGLGIHHGLVAVAAEVARKYDGRAADSQLGCGCAQNMSGAPEQKARPAPQITLFVELAGAELPQ